MARRTMGRTGAPPERLERSETYAPVLALLFVLAHLPLAIAMYRVPMLSNVHGVLTILCCCRVALGRSRPQHTALMMSYVAGSEILWRSCGSSMPFEAGKYLVSFLALAALARMRPFRVSWLPLLYLVMLLPSVLLTLTIPIQTLNQSVVQLTGWKLLVFNISGPISLGCAMCYFMRARLSLPNFQNIAVLFAAPTAGAAAVTLFAIRYGKDVTFGRTSVSVIRTEFGPNQLSGAIGLGALFLFLLFLLDDRATSKRRVIMITGIVFMLVATALTFSRGGLYDFAGAAILALFFTLRSPKTRLRLTFFVLLGVAVTNFLVLPAVDSYTGGALVRRLSNTDTTGRGEIAAVELEIWRRNPVFGVGPGRAIDYRAQMYKSITAHTEFTRMLAEHGTLGLVAIIILLYIGGSVAFRAREPRARGTGIALVAFSFLFMANLAMRLVAPSFVFGLACAAFDFGAVSATVAGHGRTVRAIRRRRTGLGTGAPLPAPAAANGSSTA